MSSPKEQQLYQTACELFNKQQYKKASLLLDEIIQINPKNMNAFFYLGNIYHIEGNLGKAIKAFNKVLNLDPNHTDAAISLSVILNDIGKYEEAQKIFDKANAHVKNEDLGIQDPHINKKFSLKHFEIAEMYFSYNRYEESLFEYNKAVTLDPENLEIRIKIAKVYSKKGYFSKALEVLKQLKAEHPEYTSGRIALGLLHYGKGNTIEAHTEWTDALRREPDNQEVQMYLNLSKSATEANLVTST